MQPTLKFHMGQFNATLRRAAQASKRAAADVVNGHAFAVALSAIKHTEKADAERMAYMLGQVGTTLNYTKKGVLRKGRGARGRALLRDDSFAARIVNARRKEQGGVEAMIWGTELEEAARKLIVARRRASGFIKSGWLWAVRDLASRVKFKQGGRFAEKEAKAVGTRKGKGTPASGTAIGIFKATITNNALIASGGKYQSSKSSNPLPVAERGLAAALAEENRNMEAHLAKKLREELKRVGAL